MNNKPDHQLDARLDALLRALPDKPVASNFTARVLQQVGRETAARPARGSFTWLRLHWLPRLAVASLPSPDMLKDFEAIRRLSQTPPADRELLALLQ
ncbi:MAG: hypothetical protein NTZ16_09145 [Verrucomicrobia bacterium]|nr:hypothetical protein [Verrucomicrobiota bacterium]